MEPLFCNDPVTHFKTIVGIIKRGEIKMKNSHYLNVAGREYFYNEYGKGEPVLLLHCSGSSHKQWNALIEKLSPSYKVYALDFLGYGRSSTFSQWEIGSNPDALAVELLLKKIKQPVRMIGHSYGGAIATQAAVNNPQKIKGLCLYEPVLFNLLRDTDNWSQWQTVMQLDNKVSHAVQQKDLTTAAKLFVHFWQSKWAWWLIPKSMKNKLMNVMPKISYEFAEMYKRGMADRLMNMPIPTRLLYGTRTTVFAKAVVDALDSILPNVETMALPKLNHLSPLTHGDKVNPIFLNCLESLAD